MKNELEKSQLKPVTIWLLVGVGMIIVQILLGGITRLTGSGLSITEWDVVTRGLLPLTEEKWLIEFEKYKQTPQFNLLNFDFTLQDFKFIFFWEWLHRSWAKLIGFVFFIPFVLFLVQKRFKKEMVRPLIILFLLGALQGAVGWIMVASGLEGDAIYVKPTRLALHFIFALGLLCYTFWFALQLMVPAKNIIVNKKLRNLTWLLLGLLTLQLIYGALMAGNKAATAAPTWPTINGEWVPTTLYKADEGIFNFLDNKITIHFIHRTLAYIILVIIIVFTIRLFKTGAQGLLKKTSGLPLLLVAVQVLLGIFSVLMSTRIVPNHWGSFEWMAQLHQLVAMFLLLSLVWMLFLIRSRSQAI